MIARDEDFSILGRRVLGSFRAFGCSFQGVF